MTFQKTLIYDSRKNASGKVPPEKLPLEIASASGNCPPGKLPPRKQSSLPPRKCSPWTPGPRELPPRNKVTLQESSQAYKMGVLAKIVNGLRLILKLIWWGGFFEDIKVLFAWTFGLVMRVIQLIWKLKSPYLFRTFQSPGSWRIESRVIAGFFQSLRWLSIYCLFQSVLLILLEIQCPGSSCVKTSERPIIT